MVYGIPSLQELEVIGIRDAGNIERERLLLRANSAVDLIRYLIIDAHSSGPTTIQDINRNVFWFPKRSVESGNIIRLYSRVGRNDQTDGSYGDETVHYHNFYWNKPTAVWDGRANAAVLVELADWHIIRSDR